MKQAGSFFAKTHFSALIEEVKKGETIEITQRGKPVARIVPIEQAPEGQRKLTPENIRAMNYFLSLKPKPLPKGVTYKDLVDRGRKR